MVVLGITTRDGRVLRKAISEDQILEVEPDPRPNVQSKTIVKLRGGDKLYCTNTFEQLTGQSESK